MYAWKMEKAIHFLCEERVRRSNKIICHESLSFVLPIVPFLNFVMDGYISYCDKTLSILLQGIKQEDACVKLTLLQEVLFT
jgi:hypothetical protein